MEALLDEAASHPPSAALCRPLSCSKCSKCCCIRICVVPVALDWNYRHQRLGSMSGPAPPPPVGTSSLSNNDAACMFPGSGCVLRTLEPDRGGHASRSGVSGSCPTSSSSPMQSDGCRAHPPSLQAVSHPRTTVLPISALAGLSWLPLETSSSTPPPSLPLNFSVATSASSLHHSFNVLESRRKLCMARSGR